jgi:hypothetical protein
MMTHVREFPAMIAVAVGNGRYEEDVLVVYSAT